MSVNPGTRLGHYEITSLLGSGGMGEVYRAHDEHLDRDIAIKVLPSGTLADEDARKRVGPDGIVMFDAHCAMPPPFLIQFASAINPARIVCPL